MSKFFELVKHILDIKAKPVKQTEQPLLDKAYIDKHWAELKTVPVWKISRIITKGFSIPYMGICLLKTDEEILSRFFKLWSDESKRNFQEIQSKTDSYSDTQIYKARLFIINRFLLDKEKTE